jgi:hypothetical protein
MKASVFYMMRAYAICISGNTGGLLLSTPQSAVRRMPLPFGNFLTLWLLYLTLIGKSIQFAERWIPFSNVSRGLLNSGTSTVHNPEYSGCANATSKVPDTYEQLVNYNATPPETALEQAGAEHEPLACNPWNTRWIKVKAAGDPR